MKDKRAEQKDRRSNGHMRSNTDRRSHRKIPEVPFTDSEGTKVTYDRCRSPDRRVNSIQVEWQEPISVVESEGDLGAPELRPGGGTGEDHVVHLLTADRRG